VSEKYKLKDGKTAIMDFKNAFDLNLEHLITDCTGISEIMRMKGKA
jgi:hypothetical protein